MARIAFERLTREEVGEIAPDSVAVLPTASIEQHGPHAPVNVDTTCCVAVANAAAEAAGKDLGVVVCPPVHFGSSHNHLPHPGVLTLRSGTFSTVIHELLDSLMLSGFRRVLVLNGHGGNMLLIQQAARDFAKRHPEMHVAADTYFEIARAALEAIPTPAPVGIAGHAGGFETALMLHLDPELIRKERIPARGRRVIGVSEDAWLATAELGRQYFEAAVAEVGKLIRSMRVGR